MDITIWYNPKCGTCQKVRAAIEAKGYTPRIVEYLKNPPTLREIEEVCRKAGMEPKALARQKEPVYAQVAERNPDRAGWIKALHDHPVLIERPVVIIGDRAVIARPPDRLAEIL